MCVCVNVLCVCVCVNVLCVCVCVLMSCVCVCVFPSVVLAETLSSGDGERWMQALEKVCVCDAFSFGGVLLDVSCFFSLQVGCLM